MHNYTPADVPGLPAGWEISLYEQGDYITLTLWRVVAYLKPYKETLSEDDALTISGGNYGHAYLPVGYTQDDVDFALGELVWKAQKFDEAEDDNAYKFEWLPEQANRPSRTDYFYRKL